MNIICIDIGNTTTHVGLSDGDQIKNHFYMPTNDIESDNEVLIQYLEKCDTKMASYCSVVPHAAELLELLFEKLEIDIFNLNYQQCSDLKINYPNPHEIGQDRLANALAARDIYGIPSIVIDMGTAVTFDVIGESGAYEGGIIAPGLQVMTRYLHEQTALLPELNAEDLITSANLGKSTVEAMKLGCAVGFTGMINALLERVLKGLDCEDKDVSIIGTGGSAGALLKNLNQPILIDQDITLRGLATAYRA